MKFIVCLLVTLGIAYGALPPLKADCRFVMCTMDLKICPDGTPAPIPAGGCCPSYSACKTTAISSRAANPLASLLSGGNLLQTLGAATQGTNLGTALSILNLINNVHQLSNDVHQIPLLINQTLATLVNGTGQATQIILDQLLGAVSAATHQNAASRGIFDSLTQNTNLLSSLSHLLPPGTSISTVLSILKLLNNVNQLNNDIHQIPVLVNQTLATLVNGAGEASQIVLQQILNLIGGQTGTSRGIFDSLTQNANLLSSLSHLLPQGTSISTVLSILKLLNNVNALNNDIHQIPVLLNQTIASLLNGAGEASQIVLQQILSLVGAQPQTTSRGIFDSLTQNTNLLSSLSHLLPQGTSISTVLSILKLLNNVNALNNDLHQIPTLLQETLQNILSGVQNALPTVIQPLQSSS